MAKRHKLDPLVRIEKLRKYVAGFKPTVGDREGEGFEGHREWRDDDRQIHKAQAYFYHAVHDRNKLEVKAWLDVLAPQEYAEHKVVVIQELLTNMYSEESRKEALLLSITTGSRPLVEFVLRIFVDFPYLERSGCANSDRFPPHMTPLMLACILNNYAIVQCLLRRGHTIQTPHLSSCTCPKCETETVSTRWDIRLVDVMRAISSEAYIWLASTDVFVMCCRLSDDLGELQDGADSEHQKTFAELELNVKRIMARIGDQAWRAQEFDLLTSNNNYCLRRTTEQSNPRFEMAMDAGMRQFMASTNSQSAMKSIFRYDWYNFGKDRRRDIWRLLRCTLLMPFIVVLHSIFPNKGTTMVVPMARFYAHTATYCWFLLACFLRPTIGYWNDWSLEYNPYAFAAEMFMYAYLAGMILEKGIYYYRVGHDTFFGHWWRWLDVCFMIVGICSANFSFWASQTREAFDPKEIDRVHWPYTEVLLLYEISLAVMYILGIAKVFYYLQFFEKIGGTIISVGICIGKVKTYLMMMGILIVAFAVGLNGLIGPYANRTQLKSDGSVDVQTTQFYSTFGIATKNLFWTMFGYMGPSSYEMSVGNTGPSSEPVSHDANFASLELLAVIFHGLMIITMLNLMVSLLVKRADEVLDNEEMEYKYTRSVVMAEYLSWEMAAPPPFNLLLVPCHWFHRNVLLRTFASEGWGEKPNGDEREESIMQRQYMDLLVTFFYRYVGVKECKYKSICRTEFNASDKEEIRRCNVQSLTGKPRPFPQDNTYRGFRHRKGRRMRRNLWRRSEEEWPPRSEYAGKGTARQTAIETAKTRRDAGIQMTQTELPPMQIQNPEGPTTPSESRGAIPPV